MRGGLKRCPRCRRERAWSEPPGASEFGWDSRNTRPRSWCLECDRLEKDRLRGDPAWRAAKRAADREYHAAARDRRLAVMRDYRASEVGRLRKKAGWLFYRVRHARTASARAIYLKRAAAVNAELEAMGLKPSVPKEPIGGL